MHNVIENVYNSPCLTLLSVSDFIKQYPMENGPEVLGLHPNAEIDYYTQATKEIWSNLINLQPQTDDTAILAQAKTFEELEIQLNKDLETLHNYFENWSLRLNPAKSVHCCFHLNHHRAERKLNLFINNSQITHSEHPKYLGIHLDRTLTFKTHLTKLKGKLSSRNNILHKLAGSSWGSDANTLRTSALALIFSTAEYCAPVWEGSCHTKLIDTQLNSTLRIITGVCQPTRIDWLPVLAHISPPELRRKEATKKMYQKLLDSPDLEINPILQSPPKHRLKSRKPIWSRGNQLLSQNFNISEAWTNSWISSDIPNKNLITSPSVKIPGFSLPRREWVLLNRFRTAASLQGASREEIIEEMAKGILDTAPQEYKTDRIRKKNEHGIDPTSIVLIQELERFNILISKIRLSLETLLRALAGEVGMDEDLERIASGLYNGQIPRSWLRWAPQTKKNLSNWLNHFMRRHEQYTAWVGIFHFIVKYTQSLLDSLQHGIRRRNSLYY
ncbi:hypothetical protein LAZ67_3006044 [Cordylochernes scorpioides]|uniref:Dynein heavy chain C-terminal domain-containing protein n=1 Tax=Cordylochernes scorpioides TaxID=51811 RepID=A0ABY6KB07_9ARAC|nr:hypothetical protein LAZ67_3006044 [Cordylochernes scorpioides]